ncbi:hypothetical protein HON22_01005 [Candidatus Peregrinibacteria bacterium]|nr:hypothetical protein [Candidatus Peregrinibacteria bacterium]
MSDDKNISIFFLGSDMSFWHSLKERFESHYPGQIFTFNQIADNHNFHPQSQYIELTKLKLDILFIDYCFDAEKCLTVAKLISKGNTSKLISTVGLHDYLASDEDISRSLLAGIRLNHIKSGEITDLIYHPILMRDPAKVRKPEMAEAKLKRELEANIIQDSRVAYATAEYYRVETSTPMAENTVLTLEHHPLEEKMSTNKVEVTDIQTGNLYYNSRFSLKLNYGFIESNMPGFIEPDPTDDEVLEGQETISPAALETRKEFRKKELKTIKKDIDAWVIDNTDRVTPKKIKVLIVDKELEILKNTEKCLDDYPFSINVQTNLMEEHFQINRHSPHIIAFAYEHIDEEVDDISDAPLKTNGKESFSRMLNIIKSKEGYEPIVVMFNAKNTSEDLQEIYGYPKTIGHAGSIDMELIVQFEKLAEKNLTKNEGKDKNTETKVFFKNSDKGSIVRFKREVLIKALDESQIYFTTQDTIPLYTVFSLHVPFKAHLTVIPHEENSSYSKEKNMYRALINCIGEQEKQKVRQFINQILGIEKTEKEEAEKREFDKKNQEAIKSHNAEAEKLAKAAEDTPEAATPEAATPEAATPEAATPEAQDASAAAAPEATNKDSEDKKE